MEFNLILDIVVVVIVFFSCLVAFLRGFVRETLTIVGLVGAVFAGLTLGPVLSPSIESWFTGGLSEDAVKEGLWGMVPYGIAAVAISYLGIFVLTLVILSVASHFIAKSVQAVGLGPVDRSLGVVFGLVRAVVLIGLLFLPFHILMSEEDKEDHFGGSHAYSYVEQASNIMLAVIPESWNASSKEIEEKTELLRDLTGEEALEDAASTLDEMIGTDEEAAESGVGYDDSQRKDIDMLINNPGQLQKILNQDSQKTKDQESQNKNE